MPSEPTDRAGGRPIDSISDDELWRMVGWRPMSPYERGRVLFPWSPDVWGPKSSTPNNSPPRAWIDWAKGEFLKAGRDPDLYLCRILRVLQNFHYDEATRTPGVEIRFLGAALASGLAVAHDKVPRDWHLGDNVMRMAEQRGLVTIDDADEWRPGMASGSGWKSYVRLTVAGQRLVEAQDTAPPPPLIAQASESQVERAKEGAADAGAPAGRAAAAEDSAESSQGAFLRNEARDRWIYEECCQGTLYKHIILTLKARAATEGWEPIETVQGVYRAARNYARAKGLPPPPPRRRGRPVRQPKN